MATVAVAGGATSADRPGRSGRRPGSSSGAVPLTKSVNDDEPAWVENAGRRPDGSKHTATGVLSDRRRSSAATPQLLRMPLLCHHDDRGTQAHDYALGRVFR